jgi:molybdopterin biosynthesis enzyme
MAAPATPSSFYKMLLVPDAQELVLEETEVLPAVTVPLHQAFGCTIAEDVTAAEPVPSFRASIKARCCKP